ncbi:response regulator [bacterium]|jgi:two-component system, chemotaxis family, chemotaxis protein CheY|nr:response regulator [bacterium]
MEKLIETYSKDPTTNGLWPDQTPIKILIIEDSPLFCEFLHSIFKGVGYTTYIALNLEQSYIEYQKNQPDVVTMDLWMPDSNALEGFTEFMHRNKGAKVMILSMDRDKDRVMQAMKEGAREYFLKPLDERHLKNVLTRIKAIALCG